MCVVYGLNYLDSKLASSSVMNRAAAHDLLETTLSYASITGIQKDIGLVGDNYQWVCLVLFGFPQDLVPRC